LAFEERFIVGRIKKETSDGAVKTKTSKVHHLLIWRPLLRTRLRDDKYNENEDRTTLA
jgi:hypothetical protein